MVGHELRNPLGAIGTALQVLHHPGTAPDERARQRAIIDRQMRHMTRLVEDLLDVSRVMSEDFALDARRVDLNEVARACLVALRGDERAQERELSLSLSGEPVEVAGDPVRLEQVVFKLLDNALRHTSVRGRVEIRVAREGEQAAVRVRDDGVGIAPEVLSRVFDLFLERTVAPARALGLALTLVRRLVEMHGGEVSARSEGPGRGSEFVVSLPLAPAALATDARVDAPAMPARRVLIIEDSPDARDALRALLEVWGHHVEVAEDGPRGFEAALAIRPDVVVVDIGLPGLDGYHVAHGLRRALGEDAVVLIALTAYGQPDDRRRALEAGFDVHLVKPVDPEMLAAALARAPARSEAR